MAKLCLNVCELARLAMPTRATAALIALLIVTPNPVAIRLLRPDRVVPQPHDLAHLVQQLELGVGHHRFEPDSPSLQSERLFQLTTFTLLHILPSMDYEAKLGINSQFVHQYLLTGKTFLTNNSWAFAHSA